MKLLDIKNNSMIKAIIGMALFSSSVVAAPAVWDGSADVSWYESSAQAYNLTTAEQLAGLAKLVNDGTSSFEGKTITLGADIFLNDTAGAGAGAWASIERRSWIPIGTSSRPFKGEFDGLAGKKNRKIYGLYLNDETKSYVGLFGYTSGVKISNLDLLVGRVTAKDNVGALTGYALTGSVTNVHSEIKVTGKSHVGGLIGYYTGDISKSSVQENVVGQDSVGGLVGYTSGAITGTVNANSYFVGDVNGRKYVGGLAGLGSSISKGFVEGSVTGDSSYVGGVIGYANGSIDSSYHIGGNVIGCSYVGGLVGYSKSNVRNSHSEGSVEGKGNYVGGLVGFSFYRYEGSVYESIYSALYSYSIGDVKGVNFVGGLVGKDSLYRYSSHASKPNVYKYISSSYAKGKVVGSKYVGGIVGWTADSSFSNNDTQYTNVRITGSYHEDGNVEGFSYVGGVAGFTTGSISGSHSKGDVVGTNNFIGGLVGQSFYKYVDTTARTFDVLTNSYSIGNVIGSNFVGGAVGSDSICGIAANSKKLLQRVMKNVSARGTVQGFSNVGGVIGGMNYRNYYSYTSYNSSLLDSCSHTSGGVTGSYYVGGVVGFTYATLKKSYSEGNVTGTGNYVGGLAGVSGPVDSSYHKGGDVDGASYVGGLIGGRGLATDSLKNSIKKSYSEGNVTGTGDYVGGLAGVSGSVESSYHRNGSVRGGSYVGGLTGFATGSVEKSYSEGNVIAKGNYVGGLFGLLQYSHQTSYRNDGSYDTVFVKELYSLGDVRGMNYVGGLIGKDSVHKLLIKYNYYHDYSNNRTPLFRVLSNIYSRGSVEGKKYVGGLIGWQSRGSDSAKYISDTYIKALLDSCYHENGSVVGDSDFVGGLVGTTYGNVKNSHSIGDVSGGSIYVGGLAGTVPSITDSYSEGLVKGDSSYVGGLAGYSTTIVSSYHKSGDVNGRGEYVGGLTGWGSVKKSYSECAVSGPRYVGGLAGFGSVDSSYHIGGEVLGTANSVGGVTGQGPVKNSYSEGVVSGLGYVGGLTGSGTVDSSYHIDGDVLGTANFVGGVTGQGSVKNSYSEGVVSGLGYVGGLTGSGTVDSSSHIGGDVLGFGSYVGGLTGNGSVSNSYSEGNVAGLDYVGGVAGSSTKIRNSNAKTDYVKGRNSVGGLVGYVTDSIEVSYFEGDSVTGIFQVGGLTGYAKSVVDSSYSTANVKGDDNVGGLIGSAYGNVSNSYALGNVDGDVDNSSAGNDNLGGLVGYQYSGSVTKSMALGNITGTTKLGGLVGRFDGTSISNSYANGNVTGGYYGDPADEVGNYYIGGLVGYAKGSLNETYSSGIVKGMDEDPVYTGCMVGYVNGSLSVTNSYYDKSKCDLGIDGGEESVTLTGTPDKTTAEMQTQSTFEDWDFVDTWKIIDDSYPFLQIYANSLTNATVETASLEGYKYDGMAKTPLVLSVKLFGETLEYETEYTIAYENNVNAGTAHINVCGVKPYGGCKVVDFEIAAIPVEPTIAAIENMAYTGRALTPEIKAYNGETLLAVTDYAVEYKDNVNAGTATVSVTMKGNYSGTASKTFTIEKAVPVISQNPKASDVILGESLAKSELTGGLANVEGSFAWKNGNLKPTLENEGYAVVFTPTDIQNYKVPEEITVPVKVLDMVFVVLCVGEITVDSSVVEKGDKYTIPAVPDSTGHDFVGVYNGTEKIGTMGDVITVSDNIVLDAKYSPKNYVIAFVNGTTELQSSEVAYGTLPKYSGDTPVKNATAKHTYTFKDWTPAIETVSKAMTYTAAFDSVLNEYVITFMNGETELQSDKVAYGVVPTAPEVILPENTAQCTYSFGGWDKKVVSVTGTATYTAVINCVENKYSVTFKNYNGTVLKTSTTYTYGTPATDISKPSNPTRTSTAQFAYSFKDWNPIISDVTEDVVYVAEYDSTVRSYTIKFVNGSITLQSDVLEYGSMPSYEGEVPTKAASTKYTYTFASWSPTIASVTGSTTYKAVFDSTKIVVSSSSAIASSSSVKQSSSSESSSSSSSTAVSSSSKTESSSSVARLSSSSKIESSSSIIRSSSSVNSSSSTGKSSSSKGNVPIAMQNEIPHFSVTAGFRNVQIAGAKAGSTYALLDLQGRILQKGRVESANFNIAVPQSGSYLVRINKQTKRVDVK